MNAILISYLSADLTTVWAVKGKLSSVKQIKVIGSTSNIKVISYENTV